RIFSAFTQEDGSTTRMHGGTGLGLSITKKLVNIMGGEIFVTSKKGVGSTFWCNIPFTVANTTRLYETRTLAGMNVLVVDEDEVTRDVTMKRLRDWQATVVATGANYEAIDNWKKKIDDGKKYAVIVNLDDENRKETILEKFSELSSKNILRILLVNSIRDRVKLGGIYKILQKPIKLSQLHDCIKVFQDAKLPAQGPVSTDSTSFQKYEAHVLIVDDNIVNQTVMSGLVRRYGVSFDVANNGVEAVNAVSEKSYDVVFMDCQMPIMDGFEATREIRKSAGANRNVAIIAMTANAMDSDREKCISAGMDDYISKPITTAALESVLGAYLLKKKQA
ncbi:MAG: response regulator, partial [Gammaproteobacteria bacterium]|nr:response regulator [Gammaproteobacteria bacterium]